MINRMCATQVPIPGRVSFRNTFHGLLGHGQNPAHSCTHPSTASNSAREKRGFSICLRAAGWMQLHYEEPKVYTEANAFCVQDCSFLCLRQFTIKIGTSYFDVHN